MGQPSPSNSDRRLDSWKEIAAFFGRDERTVRRWEKENALPVRRVPGGAKGRVFALESELSRWLSTPQAVPSRNDAVEAQFAQTTSGRKYLNLRSAGKWIAAFAVCVAVVGGIYVYRKDHGFAVHASEARSSRTGMQTPGKPATPEAEDFYLKGRYYWSKRTPDDLNKAVDYFTQAIVHDPDNAQAYVGLADCYNLLREFSVMPPGEAFPRAFAAAQKAVDLDPNSAEANLSLAFASFWGYVRVADADREFKRAIRLDPNNARAHHWYATFLAEIRRFPEARAEIERAQQLDPSSTPVLADKAFILGVAGDTPQAVALLQQIEKGEPDFLSAHTYLSDIYCDHGEFRLCLQEAETSARLQHDTNSQTVLATEQQELNRNGSRGLLETRLNADKKRYDQGLLSNFEMASDYAALNERQEALRYLEGSYEKREWALCTLLVNRSLKNLHGEPEFRDLIAKVGLPPIS
jgi:tetratricopeptide (TPR) repeat protein